MTNKAKCLPKDTLYHAEKSESDILGKVNIALIGTILVCEKMVITLLGIGYIYKYQYIVKYINLLSLIKTCSSVKSSKK